MGGGEAVQISQRVPITPGKPVLVSYWVKTEGSTDPGTIGSGDNNIGLTALWYTNMTAGAAGYGETGGVDIRLNGEYNPMVIPMLPKQAANGWTQYAFVLTPPVRGTGEAPNVGMELRLRYWHAFTGTTYWDDIVVADVSDVVAALNNKLSNGGFEANRPAYWAPTGAGATWSTDARSAGHSIALAGAGAASWTMGEAVRNWTDFIGQHGSNGFTPGEIVISGYVKALGVNTNPVGDENKFQLVVRVLQPGGRHQHPRPAGRDQPAADERQYRRLRQVRQPLARRDHPAAGGQERARHVPQGRQRDGHDAARRPDALGGQLARHAPQRQRGRRRHVVLLHAGR